MLENQPVWCCWKAKNISFNLTKKSSSYVVYKKSYHCLFEQRWPIDLQKYCMVDFVEFLSASKIHEALELNKSINVNQ
jgi:hypothetical protein